MASNLEIAENCREIVYIDAKKVWGIYSTLFNPKGNFKVSTEFRTPFDTTRQGFCVPLV